MFKKLFTTSDADARNAQIYRNIIRDAAKMGGELFGPIPKGTRREFFCLDERTWVWHEEWVDESKISRVRTTRYDVRPHGIYKAQDGQPYQPLTDQEMNHLYAAVYQYRANIHAKFDPMLVA